MVITISTIIYLSYYIEWSTNASSDA